MERGTNQRPRESVCWRQTYPIRFIQKISWLRFPLATGTPWPLEFYPEKIVCGGRFKKPDSLHELIFVEELTRAGSVAAHTAIFGGNTIGNLYIITPRPSTYIKIWFIIIIKKDCSAGLKRRKRACLCITELWAGSDEPR